MTIIFDPATPTDGPALPSWDEIVRSHSSRVYAYAYWLTGNRADAEDLAQDAFVRAFGALPTSTPRNPGGWLRRVTRNLYLDRVRHQRKLQMVALPDRDAQEIVDPRPHPAEELHRRTLDADVRRALDGLTAGTREAVVLCDLDGLSYGEIATALGVGYGTVRSRIHRGRRELRSSLRHRAPGADSGEDRS
jgi:RNA polymerase sigma-70 factor, ECF subfamily